MDTDIGGVNGWNECVWMKVQYLKFYMLRPGFYEYGDHNYSMAEIINGNILQYE